METGCAGAEHMVLSFHQTGESGVLGFGANLQGAGNKQGTNGGHSCGGKGPIVRPSTLTLFRYSTDGHCAIFSCVSPRCCRH